MITMYGGTIVNALLEIGTGAFQHLDHFTMLQHRLELTPEQTVPQVLICALIFLSLFFSKLPMDQWLKSPSLQSCLLSPPFISILLEKLVLLNSWLRMKVIIQNKENLLCCLKISLIFFENLYILDIHFIKNSWLNTLFQTNKFQIIFIFYKI